MTPLLLNERDQIITLSLVQMWWIITMYVLMWIGGDCAICQRSDHAIRQRTSYQVDVPLMDISSSMVRIFLLKAGRQAML